MQIDYLADHQEFIPTLARWHYDEWRHLRPGDSIEGRIQRLHSACNRGQIPTVVVAFHGSALLGSAKLVANDMELRPDLSPWLAGVFVSAEHRRRGTGAALIRRVIGEAQLLHVKRLYLYTPDAERLYSKLGWSVCERTKHHDVDVTLMSYDLAEIPNVTAPPGN
jgi:GNAT superfamily N-acetyltransferase